MQPAGTKQLKGRQPLAVQNELEREWLFANIGHVRRQIQTNLRQVTGAKANAAASGHPTRDRRQHIRLVPPVVKARSAVAIKTGDPCDSFVNDIERASIAVLIIKSAEGNICCFQE